MHIVHQEPLATSLRIYKNTLYKGSYDIAFHLSQSIKM